MAGIVFVVCPGRNIRLKDARILAPNTRFTVFPTGGLPGIPGPRDVEDGGEIRNYHSLGFVCTENEMLAVKHKKAKKEADDAAVVARKKADIAAGEAEKAEKRAKETSEKPPAPAATTSKPPAGDGDGGQEPPAGTKPEAAKDKKARLKKEKEAATAKKKADDEAAAAEKKTDDEAVTAGKSATKPESNEPPGGFGG